jgi:predicted O-methyltransferase YrrM
MPTFDSIWRQASSLEGWLTEAQGRRLHSGALELDSEDLAVEIGSHKGKSTIVIASGLRCGARLVTIDPFDEPRWGGGAAALDEFEANVEAAACSDRVDLLRALSSQVSRSWPEHLSIAMLYVDGAHDYPTVSADIRSWAPRVRPGGSLMIHDAFSSPGVTKAVLRHMARNPTFDYEGADGTLVHFVARPASLRGRMLLYARVAYFVRNLGIKLALRWRWPWLRVALGQRAPEHPY